jgi:flagellar motor switch protein FliN
MIIYDPTITRHSLPFFRMSDISQQIIDEVLAACKTGAEEAAAAFARTFDTKIEIAPGQQGTLQSSSAALNLDGAGLIVLLRTDEAAVALTIPANSGLVPDWCVQPDASGQSRLATLAQELGMNLLPEAWLTKDFRACWVANLAEALRRGGVPQDAAVIPLAASRSGEPASTLGLMWPVEIPESLFSAGPTDPVGGKSLIGKPARKEQPTLALRSSDLPPYTRSLLRIKVPVVVTLAEKRQSLSRIIELGPGAIIQFDKSCEEMLALEVGNRPVASGEAVKVGDKFGLRITAIALPDERFNPVKPANSAASC